MKIKVDEIDKAKEEEFEKICAEGAKVSTFKRLIEYNTPYFYIFLACIGSAMVGAPQSLFAIIFGKIMGLLTLPMNGFVLLKNADDKFVFASEDRTIEGIDWFWYNAILCVLLMIAVGVISFTGAVL